MQGLVESVVSQLGSSAGGASLSGAALHDSCAAVDTLLEQHLSSLLPRVRACDGAVAEFLLRCGEAKASMTRDVLEQLQVGGLLFWGRGQGEMEGEDFFGVGREKGRGWKGAGEESERAVLW